LKTSAAAEATKASASADTSSSTTSSAEAAATMNANANSNSTESSSSSASSSAAGATAAANGGRTTFDNSQGVELQAGAIQAAQASSATQTDIQPGDKGTESASAASSPQSVPDAANGGPLPQPTGPPSNGLGADAANGQTPPQGADAASAQTPPPSPDAANLQSPPSDVGPSPPAATMTPDSQASAQPGSAAAPQDEDEEGDLTRRSEHKNSLEAKHRYQRRDRVFRERLIRRSGTLLYF
jgi:hypothetical protein